jgi:hypothetical protein
MPDEEAAGDPQCLDGKILTTERPEEPFGWKWDLDENKHFNNSLFLWLTGNSVCVEGKGNYHALVNEERGVQEELSLRVSRE